MLRKIDMKQNVIQMTVAMVTLLLSVQTLTAQTLAVRGKTVYTMVGDPIEDGVVLIDGKRIQRVGAATQVTIPDDCRVLEADVVVPGLIDAHATIGLTGYLNQAQDQDVLERSSPIQPELRALDAYNPRERLVEWARSFGVTTVHTGHAPGEVISGQTMIAKLTGNTVNDAVIKPTAMIACTLGDGAVKGEQKSPGTRSKAVAMLRSELLAAQAYMRKVERAETAATESSDGDTSANGNDEAKDSEDGDGKKAPQKPDRNLRYEALGWVLKKEMPLLVTAHRAHDISVALRLAREFDIDIVLDGAAEAYLVADAIKDAGVPVIVHPTMMRSHRGSTENASMETASKLAAVGIPIAMQSGYEGYVPKTRIVLFEAGIAAAYGLGFDGALRACTIDAARLLGIDQRVGSIEAGKDADLALYDGDPFEYTTHCTTTIINGEVLHEGLR